MRSSILNQGMPCNTPTILGPPARYRPAHSTECERSQIDITQRKVGPNSLYRAVPAVQKLVLLLAKPSPETTPQRGSDILARYTITTTQATGCKSCIQHICTVNITNSSFICQYPPKHEHSCSQGSIVMQLTRPSQVITGTHDGPG